MQKHGGASLDRKQDGGYNACISVRMLIFDIYASVGGATRHTVVRLCMCVSVYLCICLSVCLSAGFLVAR